MRRSVIISINPKWVKKIADGKKVVELRTTKPKIETPFKCYIYCTKAQYDVDVLYAYKKSLGGVELRCKDIYGDDIFGKYCNGFVVGEFWCDSIDAYTEKDLFEGMDELNNSVVEEKSCVPIDDILNYKGDREYIYGWNIKGLMLYETPRPLSDFGTPINEDVQKCEHRSQVYNDQCCDTGYIKCGFVCDYRDDWCIKCKKKPLTRAPQSWGYAEEIVEDVPR